MVLNQAEEEKPIIRIIDINNEKEVKQLNDELDV
jgi:hypothetical protein